MEENDIDVIVTNDSVTIKGEKKEEKEDKDKNYYYMERSYGSFCRVIPVEAEIESGKAQAHFKNGILDIKIPKNQSAKAKETKVSIKLLTIKSRLSFTEWRDCSTYHIIPHELACGIIPLTLRSSFHSLSASVISCTLHRKQSYPDVKSRCLQHPDSVLRLIWVIRPF